MRNTLTSIAEHSDWLETTEYWYNKRWLLHRKRVDFGKQPLAIWQFVPCKLVDGIWVVLEEPYEYQEYLRIGQQAIMAFGYNVYNQCQEFQEAKSRCIFEITGEYLFKESNIFYIIDFLQEDVNRIIICKDSSKEIHTVEYLADHKRLKLTASAIKELGL